MLYWAKGIFYSSKLFYLFSDVIGVFASILFVIDRWIGPIQKSEMSFDVGIVLIFNDWSTLCKFCFVHERFGVGREICVRVGGGKLFFGLLNSFLLLVLLNLLS